MVDDVFHLSYCSIWWCCSIYPKSWVRIWSSLAKKSSHSFVSDLWPLLHFKASFVIQFYGSRGTALRPSRFCSLLCRSCWVEENVRYGCGWTSLQLLSSAGGPSGGRDGRGISIDTMESIVFVGLHHAYRAINGFREVHQPLWGLWIEPTIEVFGIMSVTPMLSSMI